MKTIKLYLMTILLISTFTFPSYGNTNAEGLLTEDELYQLKVSPIAPKNFDGEESKSFSVFSPSESEKKILMEKYLLKKSALKSKKALLMKKRSHRGLSSLKVKSKKVGKKVNPHKKMSKKATKSKKSIAKIAKK